MVVYTIYGRFCTIKLFDIVIYYRPQMIDELMINFVGSMSSNMAVMSIGMQYLWHSNTIISFHFFTYVLHSSYWLRYAYFRSMYMCISFYSFYSAPPPPPLPYPQSPLPPSISLFIPNKTLFFSWGSPEATAPCKAPCRRCRWCVCAPLCEGAGMCWVFVTLHVVIVGESDKGN